MNEISIAWVQGLFNPKCYPHPVDHVRLIETHISWVLLTGSIAYKIKKPVKFSFVDFSTQEKRRWFCEEEVRLNRRLAPEIYLGVVPISGSPSEPSIDGPGVPFEFAVKMKQFSSEHEIQDMLAREANAESGIVPLAESIALFHSTIATAGNDSSYGEPDVVWQPIQECCKDIPFQCLTQVIQKKLTRINRWLQAEWRKMYDIILSRKQTGFVRECHGDLHLGNVTMFEGQVCVFDALEFEPKLRWIDVMSEIAFFVMDLEKHGHQELSSLFLNRYLEITGDYEGLRVFKMYQMYRALVRAKVAGLRLEQIAESRHEEEKAKEELTGYIELAYRFIDRPTPALILMHGVSGTGKTTVSTEIIKAMNAIRIRSDVERKRLIVESAEFKRKGSENNDLYHSDMTARTYDRLRSLAGILIQAKFIVIVDATFLEHHQRESFRKLASELRCLCFIMDVFAPNAVLAERIQRRSVEGRDASDATIEVMKRQQETEERFTQEEELSVLRVDSTAPESILSSIRELKEKARIGYSLRSNDAE